MSEKHPDGTSVPKIENAVTVYSALASSDKENKGPPFLSFVLAQESINYLYGIRAVSEANTEQAGMHDAPEGLFDDSNQHVCSPMLNVSASGFWISAGIENRGCDIETLFIQFAELERELENIQETGKKELYFGNNLESIVKSYSEQ